MAKKKKKKKLKKLRKCIRVITIGAISGFFTTVMYEGFVKLVRAIINLFHH